MRCYISGVLGKVLREEGTSWRSSSGVWGRREGRGLKVTTRQCHSYADPQIAPLFRLRGGAAAPAFRKPTRRSWGELGVLQGSSRAVRDVAKDPDDLIQFYERGVTVSN